MTAYIFDVDGVLTDVNTRKMNTDVLLPKLITILKRGEPVGFITGRGMEWLTQNAIDPLEAYINEKGLDIKLLNNLYVSGEFGGVSMVHDNGVKSIKVDEKRSISDELRKKLIDKTNEFSDVVYPETDKQTMVSSPSHPHTGDGLFNDKKHEIMDGLRESIKDHPDFEVHSDRFAINTKNKDLNKHHATRLFLDWLETKHFKPQKYIAFGDSISDLEIGQELYDRKLPMQFVFVGKEHELDGKNIEFPYIVTKEDFDAGTVEFLNK